MARKRGNKAPSYSPILGLLVIATLAGGGWYVWHHRSATTVVHEQPTATPVDMAEPRIDPSNEGKRVRITGEVRMDKPARDPRLGILSDSAVLWRKVEMLQWIEHCVAGKCGYALDWSERAVHSSAFHEKAGHDNPGAFPLSSETFLGENVRLGAFRVDNARVPDESGATPYPIRLEQLPENLAATFRVKDGVLVAATNAGQPEAGDLRVTYRVLPAGLKQTWSGVQRGDRLQ
ncbi:MAG: TMEM43 family protein [Dokdonella sp.]|uniref:TMEM43 family protein n=1 Tax=Dokdonella sp. TaxID=2291710 RepID=UPI0032662CE3